MKFYTTDINLIDRHTEPRIESLKEGSMVLPRYEEITLQIKLQGSGDTRSFSSIEIISIINQRIFEIQKG